jgi:hypothetical protein
MATTLLSDALGGSDPSPLVAAMLRMAVETLGNALDAVLRQTDDYLFDHTQGGGGDHELTALRDLRRARIQVAQRFEDTLIRGFQQLLGDMPASTADKLVLSLLGDDELEEQLANQQMAENLARAHAPVLELITQRLGAMLRRVEMAASENPVDPVSLAACMSAAVGAATLPTSVRIVLYKFLERELGKALGEFYERIDASLACAGFLPHLTPVKAVEAPPAAPPAPLPESATPLPEPQAASEFTASGPADQAMFSSLISMLQSWRQTMATSRPGNAPAAGPELGAIEMFSVLSLMQSDPPQSLQQALGDNRMSLAEQLRREVLAGARRLGMGGETLNLSNTDEDAIDLVGMLFDVLLDERHFEPDVRSKISRMLVPYVKVAVKDRRMFLHKGHPARRLLNAVAEVCEGNRGEGPQERELLERVDATIDRLVAEFNEDLAIFETLEQELRAFMEQHRKRIELAERRAAETQRGRERLELAREEAATDLARRRGTRELPPVLDEFMTRYARHHLSQVILREGRHGTRYGESLHAIEDVLAGVDHAGSGVPPALAREPLLAIFASSGCVGAAADEAFSIIQRTLAQLAAGEDVAAHTARLPQQAETPVDATPHAEPVLAIVAGTATLDFDPVVADRMRTLEVGTWLQLTSESGRIEPAKVSWISPISARLLFVNRRGIRVLVASAEELAAMARLGKLQLREADNAFEDAMHQMLGRLQSSAVSG